MQEDCFQHFSACQLVFLIKMVPINMGKNDNNDNDNIMIMTSGWGLQQRPTSPITKNTIH